MAWVRLEDTFPEHPKIVEAGGDAAWLHVCALAYCTRNLTNGRIPKAVLRQLSDRKSPKNLAEILIHSGLWEIVDGGYLIHDYLKYNPTREEVLEARTSAHEAKAQAGKAGGIASGISRRAHTRSKPEANPKQEASRNEANGEAKAKQNEAPSHPIPIDEYISDISTPVDTPNTGGKPVDIRRNQTADAYATIATNNTNGINNPNAYKHRARQTALNHPDLDRYLTRWPDAPPNAIAAWLHGDKHSMAYYHDTEDQA